MKILITEYIDHRKQKNRFLEVKPYYKNEKVCLVEIPTQGLYYNEQPIRGSSNQYVYWVEHILVFSFLKGTKKEVQTTYHFPRKYKNVWSVSTDKDAIQVTLTK